MLICFIVDERLTNILPKMSLTTLPPPWTGGIAGRPGIWASAVIYACTTLGCVCVFPGVFLSSRVTGACPVTTDLIMRGNVRTTATWADASVHTWVPFPGDAGESILTFDYMEKKYFIGERWDLNELTTPKTHDLSTTSIVKILEGITLIRVTTSKRLTNRPSDLSLIIQSVGRLTSHPDKYLAINSGQLSTVVNVVDSLP